MSPPTRRPLALVTGASAGIGRDLAWLLASHGHDLVLVARSRERLEQLGASLSGEHGIAAHILPHDLAIPQAAAAIADELQRRGLSIDILVNNAGFGHLDRLDATDPSILSGMMQVNIVALTELTRLVLPGMIERGHGRILNVASVAGFLPGPYLNVYYASKAFVISHSLALAHELRRKGITVTCLCPGPTRTEFQQRAGMASARLFRAGTMDSMPVAKAGYRAMMKGKRLAIPGVINKLSALAARLAPPTWAARAAARLNRGSSG